MTPFTTEDERFMRRALEIAAQARTHPNPMVGAVVVKDGVIVGEGYHKGKPTPHAEAMAFANTGEAARGATIYVTLEPCAHYFNSTGEARTPCSARCITAGVARVVCAIEDPDTRVAGQGFAALRDAGIQVEVGLLADEAREQNRAYLKHRTTGLPYVLHKAAMTLDGKIATSTGDSKWITGEEARLYVHQSLRHEVDAIVVGIGTVLKDDPSLTTRLPDGNGHDAFRVIIDSKLRMPETAKVVVPGTLVFCTESSDQSKRHALTAAGVEIEVLPPDENGRVDLRATLRHLADRGFLSILLESGGELAGSFYERDLVDRILYFVAPKIIGGRNAPTPVEGPGVDFMWEAVTTGEIRVRQFGSDIALEADIGHK